MSILVHPDKNQDDPDRAQQAFESMLFICLHSVDLHQEKKIYCSVCVTVVNKAWKTLESEETRAKCMDVIEEARARTEQMVSHSC